MDRDGFNSYTGCRSVQFKVLNTQLSGNVTMGVGNSSQTIGEPPIFWEEEGFPIIEYWDGIYADMISRVIPATVINISKYPGQRFLVFHYLGKSQPGRSSESNRSEAMNKNRGNLADRVRDSKFMQAHEVPYASTVEGGINAIAFPAFGGQNEAHGRALREFYKRNNFIGGEEFWVPIPVKAKPKIVPVIDPELYKRLTTPRRFDKSPFQVIPFGAGIPAGVSKLFQWLCSLL